MGLACCGGSFRTEFSARKGHRSWTSTRLPPSMSPRAGSGLTGWRDGDAWLGGGTWLFSEPQAHLRRLIDLSGMGWPPLVVTRRPAWRSPPPAPSRNSNAAALPAAWIAAPLIGQCCRSLLASFKIWNMATVGGNICLALPAGVDDVAHRRAGWRRHDLDAGRRRAAHADRRSRHRHRTPTRWRPARCCASIDISDRGADAPHRVPPDFADPAWPVRRAADRHAATASGFTLTVTAVDAAPGAVALRHHARDDTDVGRAIERAIPPTVVFRRHARTARLAAPCHAAAGRGNPR